MNTVIDKLFITPMSWLLAVPIVLLDRMLAPARPELGRAAAALRLCSDPGHSGSPIFHNASGINREDNPSITD